MRTARLLLFPLILAACSSTSEETPPVPAVPQKELATELLLKEVALFQGVKVGLMKGGARVESPSAPVIAGRPGVLRVYVDDSHRRLRTEALVVEAELDLIAADGRELRTLRLERKLTSFASESYLASTFVFPLAPEDMVEGASYSLTLRTKSPGFAADAVVRYPETGTEPLGVRAGAERLKVRLIPLVYDVEGERRVPDTTPARIEKLRAGLFDLYPTASVEISVREPLLHTTVIEPDGEGWDEALLNVMDQRAKDGVAADVFDVGFFQPTDTMAEFCRRGGCILGLAPLAGKTSVTDRVSLVTSFKEEAGETLAHEVGHSMGREHAPCGAAAGPDRKFPYSGGASGSWGYQLSTGALVDPDTTYDMMGYCAPQWISDYTYAALFERLAYVNANPNASGGGRTTGAQQRVVRAMPDGSLRWRRSVSTSLADSAPSTASVSFLAADGRALGSGAARSFTLDHLPGTYYVLPVEPAGTANVELRRGDVRLGKLSILRH